MYKVKGPLTPMDSWNIRWQKAWGNREEYYSKRDLSNYPYKFANKMIKGSKRKLKILEMGVGAGRILLFFEEKGHDVIGVDFEPNIINALKKKFPKIKVMVGNILNTNFANKVFDLITMFGVIHYLSGASQVQQAMNEMFRVLKPGGEICLSAGQENFIHKFHNWINYINCIIRRKRRVFSHICFTKTDLLSTMEKAGFKHAKIESFFTMRTIYSHVPFFRKKGFQLMDDSEYELNMLGKFIMGILLKLFPSCFGSYWIVTAQKPK